MKHLRGYKTFEGFEKRYFKFQLKDEREKEIINSIEDICLDLTDEGFNIYLYYNPTLFHDSNLRIHIDKKNGYIYSDVSEVVDRLRSYLGSSFKYANVLLARNNWCSLDDCINIKNENIYGVIIAFDI